MYSNFPDFSYGVFAILQMVSVITGPWTIYGNFHCSTDGLPDQVWQTVAATDGPALSQVVPCFVLPTYNKW